MSAASIPKMFAAELQRIIIWNRGVNLENYLLPYEKYDVNFDNTWAQTLQLFSCRLWNRTHGFKFKS